MEKGFEINLNEVKLKNQVFNKLCEMKYYESADFLKKVANLSIGVADCFLADRTTVYSYGNEAQKIIVSNFLNLCDVKALNDSNGIISRDKFEGIRFGAGAVKDALSQLPKNDAVDALITELGNLREAKLESVSGIELVNANNNEPTDIKIKGFEKVPEREIKKAEKVVEKAEKKAGKKANKNQDNKTNKKPSKLFIKIAGGVVTIGVVIGGVLTIKQCNEKDKDTQIPVEWNTGDESSSDKIPYVNPAEERENSTHQPKEEDRNFNDSSKEDSTVGTSDRNLSGLINTKPQEKETETETTTTSTEKSDNTNDPFEDIFGEAEPEM